MSRISSLKFPIIHDIKDNLFGYYFHEKTAINIARTENNAVVLPKLGKTLNKEPREYRMHFKCDNTKKDNDVQLIEKENLFKQIMFVKVTDKFSSVKKIVDFL